MIYRYIFEEKMMFFLKVNVENLQKIDKGKQVRAI